MEEQHRNQLVSIKHNLEKKKKKKSRAEVGIRTDVRLFTSFTAEPKQKATVAARKFDINLFFKSRMTYCPTGAVPQESREVTEQIDWQRINKAAIRTSGFRFGRAKVLSLKAYILSIRCGSGGLYRQSLKSVLSVGP